MATDVVRCATCGELSSGPLCATCGVERPADGRARDRAAHDRDATAESRDRVAELRDRDADEQDALADGHEQPAAAARRAEAARDRGRAGVDRTDAAGDRASAAGDREEAGRERATAFRDKSAFESAADRALETLESMSDAFETLDSEWRFTYLNPQTEAILDRRREDLIGRRLWDEFPEAVGTRFYEEFHRAVRDGVPVRFEETYEPLGRTLEVRAFPVPDGLAVYYTDVTEERRRDARSRQTERLEMLGRLTAGVAHDFNNLLTAIGGFAQLGQAGAVDEGTTEYFDEIWAASQKAVALTRQLLAFGGEQDLSPAVIDLNDVVDGLSSLMRHLMPPGIELRLALSPRPVVVFADPSQIEQVVLNLVVNGRDAIDTTGSITVSTTNDAPAGVEHDVRVPAGWLQVADTGSGIPDDVMPHIFDPFFTTKPPETGTGLGLATIYGVVTQSGGSVAVESAVGVGTTFTIALPAEQSATT